MRLSFCKLNLFLQLFNHIQSGRVPVWTPTLNIYSLLIEIKLGMKRFRLRV